MGSGGTTPQPTPSLTKELLELKLSEGQRRTILKYAELPAHLSERLAANRTVAKRTQFTLDELDELLDHVETSVYRAKGNEKQQVLRIIEKVSELLGSTIDPDEISEQRPPKKMNTVFQIKVTLMGIAPLIWRRIQTQDCTLVELHDLLQVTMGWEFEHPYRFIIGGVEYADLEMASEEDVQDACDTNLSAILPAQNRRPRSITSTTLGISGCINWSWRNGSRPNRECSIPSAWQARERVRQKTVAVPGATLTSWRRSVTPIIEDTKRCWNGSVANSIQRDLIWSQ